MTLRLNSEEIYERWADEIEETKDLPYAKSDKYRNLIIILQTCEQLLSQIERPKSKKINQLQMISRLL